MLFIVLWAVCVCVCLCEPLSLPLDMYYNGVCHVLWLVDMSENTELDLDL